MAFIVIALAATWWAAAGTASGATTSEGTPTEGPTRFVDVLEVSGYIDVIELDYLHASFEAAESTGAEAVVIQLDSSGDLISQADLDGLVARLADAAVPVVVWVGPSGAEARGGAGRLVTEAPLAGMAQGSRLGPVEDPAPAAVQDRSVGAEEAFNLGLVGLRREEAADLQNLLIALDGKEVGGRVLETADLEAGADGEDPRATLNVQARLAKLTFGDRLLHTVASPAVAYLLLCAALVLLVFEYFTAGVGVAGVVGAVSLILASYGLAVLPTSPVGLLLMVLGVFGYSIDVQTGVPRVWTGVGVVAFVAGSLVLFDDGVDVGWIPLVAGVVGVALMMLAGLPSTVRSRFSTPTIGRSTMIGEMGLATAALDPEGVVRVRDALWPARTNRATPIAEGDAVRVVGIDGVRLEVEPESGGARDYRERGRTASHLGSDRDS